MIKKVLFLVSIFLHIFCFSQSKEEKEGDKAFDLQDFESAKNWYKQVFAKTPESIKINSRLSLSYLELFQGNNALKHINMVFQKDSIHTKEMLYTKARCLQLTHQFDSAAIYYKKSDPLNANKRDVSKKIKECSFGILEMASPKNFKIRNINQVNSKAHEIAPKITADFRKMYFTSQRSNTATPENIYLSESNGGAWTPPINIGEPINTETVNDACVGLSPDGQTMYVYKGVNGGDIYESELKGKKWSVPKPMPFNTIHRETSICISPDARTLYFTRQLLDEKGAKIGNSDIFYCRKNINGEWSKSVKMGSNINSEYDEESPYMHPDGKTFYFSSKGHSSMGGYDVFKSEAIGLDWSMPVNLGYPLNTAADERNFVISANNDYALYAAQHENQGMGGLDIYIITIPPTKKPDLALLSGKITDELSGEPIEAKITITDNDLNEIVAEFHSNASTGEYLVSLPSGKNYGINIEKTLHVFYSENIYLKANSGFVPHQKNIQMPNLSKGSKMILRNIFFANASAQLSASSNAELDKLYKLMMDNPLMRIQILGHTDNIGEQNANQVLSQKRAESVAKYLITKGINPNRLQSRGFGSSKPLTNNTNEEDKAKNRRTEFIIL